MINISSKTKNMMQCIFLISLMCITTYLVFKSLDINLLTKVVSILDYKFVFLGFVFMFLYIAFEGLIINLIIKTIHGSSRKSLGFKVGIIGLYYNLITPMASGSQPMQVYELSKANISPSKSTAVVVNKTILFQVSVTIYCALLMLFNIELLQSNLKSIFIFIVFGMIMNVIMLGFGFFIVLNPSATKKITYYILNLLCKVKFLKFLENKRTNIDEFVDEYNYSVKLFIKNKKALLLSFLLTFIQLTVYFSIAYCINKALNLTGHSYVLVLSLQVFLYMAVSSMPTPGNIGANEIAFFTIFSGIFPKEFLGYSVFLYGIFVYYFLLIFCGLFTILKQINIKDKISFSF